MPRDTHFRHRVLANLANLWIAIFKERTLDSVCLPFRKVPYVANFEVINLVLAIFVDGRHADFPSVDISPFSLDLVSRRSRHSEHGSYHTMPM